MEKTGRVKIANGEARLDGSLLARKGADDPLGAAADFLSNLGLDGKCVTVTGASGTVGDKEVFFITSAKEADEALCGGAAAEGIAAFAAPAPRRAPAAKKAAKRKAKPAKRPKNRPAKKSGKQPRKPKKAAKK